MALFSFQNKDYIEHVGELFLVQAWEETTMADFHMPKGYGFFISGTSLISLSLLALFFVIVSWAIGGTDFKNSIYGDLAMTILVAGVVVGAVLTYIGQKRGHRQN